MNNPFQIRPNPFPILDLCVKARIFSLVPIECSHDTAVCQCKYVRCFPTIQHDRDRVLSTFYEVVKCSNLNLSAKCG